jgi:Cu/Ag efflux protein CusF
MNVAHKSIMAVLLAVSFVFTAATRIWSQEVTNPVKSSAESAREEARQRRAKNGMAKGSIKEIDLLRHQIKVATEDGLRTFPYSSRTYIFRDKEKITADKLKVGEIVALHFNTDKDGAVLVQRIKARTPSELMEPPSIGPDDAKNSPASKQP